MESCRSSHIQATENVKCNSFPYSNLIIFQRLPSSRAGSRIHACCWLFKKSQIRYSHLDVLPFLRIQKNKRLKSKAQLPTLPLEAVESFQNIRKLSSLAKFQSSPACFIFMAVRNLLQSFWL